MTKCCVCDKLEPIMQMTLDNLFCDRCYSELKRRMKKAGQLVWGIPYNMPKEWRHLINYLRWIYAPKEDTEDNRRGPSKIPE